MTKASEIRASLAAALREYDPAIPIRSAENPAPPEPYWDITLQLSETQRETGQRYRQTDAFQLRFAGASEDEGMAAVSYLFEQMEYLPIPGRTLAGTGIAAERTEEGLLIRVRYVYHLLKAAPTGGKMNTLTQKGTIKDGEA
ncbi:phage tail terminator family protein [Gorillibacterium timonense]|uniref:phage tail terminator family protein n=1 Tax=Gorillibacterium timonense TaxID=1689269 RepID=UPI00071E34EF|nr:hypothetical protein [Gorillibacterium timonense]